MAFTDTLLRLQRLAHLIQRKSTGSPQQLADKLGVSVRTVDNLLNVLRNFTDVEIEYCRERCSYYFARPVKISFDFIIPLDSGGDVKGGRRIITSFWADAEFLRGEGASLWC
jgi:hypothetical protein